jgi:hypothetical protein
MPNSGSLLRTLAWVSLGLNAVLGGFLAWRGPVVAPPGYAAETATATRKTSTSSEVEPVAPRTNSIVSGDRDRPDWAMIRNDDWQVYLANLRRLACPERTIQAIVVADVQRWFDREWAGQPPETNYWMNGSAREAARRQVRELRRHFVLEERAFLEQLLGVPWHDLQAYVHSLESEAWGNMLLGFLPEDRIETANGLFIQVLDYWEHLQELEARYMTVQELAAVRGEMLGIVAKFGRVMSPVEIEEMELRIMTIDVLDVWGVEEQFGSALSGREFRELLRIQRGDTSPFESLFLREFLEEAGDPALLPVADPARQQVQSQQLRALLGDRRFEGYQRARDFEYRHLSRSIRGLGLPTETVWTVYDIRRMAREAAAALRADPLFAEADRVALLETIREEARTTLRNTLGAAAYEAYAQDQGDWIEALVNETP